ncbi:MAG TPA: restriction endonuclease [Mucilaginibacter sp.]|jgi:putative restriction endonuclease|nr:restriction endonuclease [Mucilaginibacter sp.]
MKFYLGVTDNNWFNYLSEINPEDINFWQPGGNLSFKALQQGAPFLFKLKSPLNAIGGVGFFSSFTFLPLSIAWDTFENRNGTPTYPELQKLILNYRSDKLNHNPIIGCIVLTNPIFFKREDWIPVPTNWSKSIVQGKTYSTDDNIGEDLWRMVERTLDKYMFEEVANTNQLMLNEPELRYGNPILQKVRLGQGAFRVLVTDAYTRRCAISGEKTLPVLEAAHIKPFSLLGPHTISNGILLRSDLHKLFDSGYVTVTKDFKVEVSKRIKEEFDNGKDYYKYHGKDMLYLPLKDIDKPSLSNLEWHNSTIYNG